MKFVAFSETNTFDTDSILMHNMYFFQKLSHFKHQFYLTRVLGQIKGCDYILCHTDCAIKNGGEKEVGQRIFVAFKW